MRPAGLRIASVLFILFAVVPSIQGICQNLKVADNGGNASRRDSVVIVPADGDTTVVYLPSLFDIGQARRATPRQFRPTEEPPVASPAAQDHGRRAARNTWRQAIDRSGRPGRIPYEEGMSPTGARTYTVPVMTAPGLPFVPSVALTYSSQAGNGVAGYGWTISCLSGITLANSTVYYNGESRPASYADPVFHRDGMPLVRNTELLTDDYPYITARGRILARITSSAGYARKFEVLYPNGTRAEYGTHAFSSFPLDSYPVTRIEDVQGNYMTFGYDYRDGIFHVTDIRYGGNASRQPEALIHFDYDDRQDCVERFFLGTACSERRLLRSVVSSIRGEELRTYTLSHSTAAGTSLLGSISCSAGQEHLNPLTFGYDNRDQDTGGFEVRDTLILSQAFLDADHEFVYRRGKFSHFSFGDGIIIYPAFSNYAELERRWVFGTRSRYGSTYSPDQQILVSPCNGSFFSEVFTITAGEGFQTVEAVDVDADGVDEIVKVNTGSGTSGRTDLTVTVYKFTGENLQLTSRSFSVQVDGNVENPTYRSPSNMAFFFGDYVGDGRTRMLAYTYDGNGFGKSQTSGGTLIDLGTGDVLVRQAPFSLPVGSAGRIISLDVDGDSRTELCRAVPSGLEHYTYGGPQDGFTPDGTYTGFCSADLPDDAGDLHFTDLNADGQLDIVVMDPSSDTWSVRSFDGKKFNGSVFHAPHSEGDRFMFIDVDRDGLADLAAVRSGFLQVHLNDCGTISATACGHCPVSDQKGVIPCNICDYTGMSSFIKVEGHYVYGYSFGSNLQERRLLTSFDDGSGFRSRNGYIEMSSYTSYLGFDVPEVYTVDASLPADGEGFAKVTMPEYLLYDEQAWAADGGTESLVRNSFHRYFNATASTLGLGFCGFRMVRSVDALEPASGSRTTVRTYHDPEKFGCVIRQEQVLGSGSPYRVIEQNYDSNSTTYGKLSPRLVSTTESDALTGIVSTTSYGYGSYDLPTMVLTGRRAGDGEPQVEMSRRTYTHSISASRYVLGALTEETVTREADGSGSESWKTRTQTSYDSLFRPECTQTYVGHDGASLVSEQQWQYDSHGNVTCERTASYGATTYNETSYTYDPSGRHVTSSTDALGRTTTYSGYDRYGNPAQSSDWLGRSTSCTYDAWGDLALTTLPDGSVQTVATSWSQDGEPGVVCVTETATGSPDTKVWSDALGREVRRADRRFDGGWLYSDSGYDHVGRLARTSLPHGESGPVLWNTYTYDGYGRRTRLDGAGGEQTTWEYSGTSTTVTSEGVSSTSTVDASGNVVSVSDPGGTITYALRDDAQPARVTVTPAGGSQGVVTTFSYDAYGRRTGIVDPSAGTRTTSYTDYADGTGSVSSTGPNGTVTRHHDRHGRTTAVIRPEFSTSYVYGTSASAGSFGRLVSETSSNGTGRSLTYDSLGRVVTETEYADSAHWLRKTYGYGDGSLVSSVRYETQDGEITTEEYRYANGHGTGVILPESMTPVWDLHSENALGQPTEVLTGMVWREYSYTPSGRPQRRRALNDDSAAIQDLSYAFEPLNGNLLWRRDDICGYSESFQYDGLNRLTSARQEATGDGFPTEFNYDHADLGFASNGNVLRRDNDGILDSELEYSDAVDPYRVTEYRQRGGTAYAPEYGEVRMTSFDRPAGLAQMAGQEPTTVFTYNASGNRTRMTRDEDAFGIHMDRWYLGGVYERDEWRDGRTEGAERLFLGGTAYDAPMVLVKAQSVNGGEWTPFNILRDNQGSITHVASFDGMEVVETLHYDPWGLRLLMDDVMPEDTLAGNMPLPDDMAEPDTLLIGLPRWQMAGQSLYVGGHGYTGHEHLPGWGLINMNARLYDPAICRFLSPDPLLQDPVNTQNFNRYTYCLNNPLKYTDESGEFVVIDSFLIGLIGGGWDRGKQMARNDLKIWGGLFVTDKNKTIGGRIWELVSRFTWQLPQTTLGFLLHHSTNTFRIKGGIDTVEYLHGATVSKHQGRWGGITLGSFILGSNYIEARDDNALFQHEFGHYLQSQEHGLFWLFDYGIESGISALVNNYEHHSAFYTEQDANARSIRYFADNYGESYAAANWKFKSNMIKGYKDEKPYSDISNLTAINKLIISLFTIKK